MIAFKEIRPKQPSRSRGLLQSRIVQQIRDIVPVLTRLHMDFVWNFRYLVSFHPATIFSFERFESSEEKEPLQT